MELMFFEKLLLKATFIFKKYGHENHKKYKVFKNLFEILAIIRSAEILGKKIYVSSLSELLNQPMSAVSRTLSNMEEKGLITRETDKEDRRNTYILATEKGASMYIKMLSGAKEFVAEGLKKLSEEERKTYIRLTAKLFGVEGDQNV